MIIVTAPSKTQKPPAETAAVYRDFTIPLLLDKSIQLIAELRKLSSDELAALMKTSDKLTTSTYRLIHNFSSPFHLQNASHAIRTFQGDAYQAIDSENYSTAQLDHAQKHLVILSGLYGLLRPLDLIQPYRLEMGLKFAPSGNRNLYQFWKEELTEKLVGLLEQTTSRTIVNLASDEYAKVLDKKQLAAKKCRIVEISFQQPHPKGKDGYKTIPIHSKRARGKMIDFSIKNTIAEAKRLQQFSDEGYAFMPPLSSQNCWVFRRK